MNGSRNRIVRRYIIAVFILCAVSFIPSGCRHADGGHADDIRSVTACGGIYGFVNALREESGLPPLEYDERLAEVSEMKSRDIYENGYFSHISPVYGTPFEMLRAAGITYARAGENIARGYGSSEEVMLAWMASDSHRALILGEYRYIGVGRYGDVWVQLFRR